MLRIRTDLGTFAGAVFMTSSYTNPDNCVAVATADFVGVKDSKDPRGPVLKFERDQWSQFIEFARGFEV